jgi:hypothetical protein
LALSVIAGLAMYFYTTESSTLFVVLFTGALGGTANNYLRMRDLPADEELSWSPGTRSLAILQLYVSPLLAGLFAVIFYSVLQAKLLEGSLFPRFADIPDAEYDPQRMIQFLWYRQPVDGTECARVIVWSFVAGFAERFVPNIIDRLGAEAKTKAATPRPGQSGGPQAVPSSGQA